MATKVFLTDGVERVGSMQLYDAKPDFDILHECWPSAKVIYHNWITDEWTIDIGPDIEPAICDRRVRAN